MKDFFLWLIQYDWKSFDAIEDVLEQSEQYQKILDQFRILVTAEASKSEFDFNELHAFLQTDNTIAALPFMGKLHVVVNPNRMKGQLIGIAKKAAYDIEKAKLADKTCGCELRNRYEQHPDFENLLKTGIHNDGYYEYTLYECKQCRFKWSTSAADDDSGKTSFQQWKQQ